jgi:anti-anti-sigma regulatory factor
VLLKISQELQADGGELVFCSIAPQVLRTVELTGFLARLPVFASQQEALDYLAKRTGASPK